MKRFVALASLIFGLSGCVSMFEHLREDRPRPVVYPAMQEFGQIAFGRAKPTFKTQSPLDLLVGCTFLLVDLPFSFVLDTLAMPEDLQGQIDFDRGQAQYRLKEQRLGQKDVIACERARAIVNSTLGQAALGELAKSSSQPHVSEYAFEKLTDQSVLSQIAASDSVSDFKIREQALARIHNQAFVLNLALNDHDLRMRRRAVLMIENQEALAEIAETDSDRYLQIAAVARLHDQKLLASVSLTALNSMAGRDAYGRLNETGWLYLEKLSPRLAPLIAVKCGAKLTADRARREHDSIDISPTKD